MFGLVEQTTGAMPFTYMLCLVMMIMHIGFGLYEMFAWKTMGAGLAKKRDNFELDALNLSRAIEWSGFIAFNQGTYNLFLAAGLFFALGPEMTLYPAFALFFAGCIAVAGLAGAYTGIKLVLFVQTLPGLLLFTLVYTNL